MNVDFNFGEHFHYNTDGIWIGLFTTFLGAFLGFASALWLNRREEKKIKNNELKNQIRIYKDKLNYIILYIDSVKETINIQLNDFDNFAKEVRYSPLKIHLLTIAATSDFERLKNSSSNEMLEAYLYFQSDITDEKLLQYTNFFNHADYLNKMFSEYELINTRHITYIFEYMRFVQDEFENIALQIGLKAKNIQKQNPENYESINEYKYLNNFTAIGITLSHQNFDLQKVKDLFLEPLKTTVFNVIDDESFSDSLFIKIRKALTKLENIEANSTNLAEEFTNPKTRQKIEIAVKFIDKFKSDLVASINNKTNE